MREQVDDLGGGLRIIRREGFFSLGTDAVLLSQFVSMRPADRIIDLGAGTGAIPLLLTQRIRVRSIVALELQPELAALCRRSVALNDLAGIIHAIEGDLRNVRALFPAESFDLAVCNPPYLAITGSQINPHLPMAIARHELCCNLADVAKAFAWLVRYGGKAALVHRPQRLGDIFCLFREQGLEPKRLQFVYPRPRQAANMVLIEAVKGAKAGLKILPPLTLRGDRE